MGTLNDSIYDKEASNHFTESEDAFRRRTLNHRQWRMPRRYVIALMFFVLLIIKIWKELNVSFMLIHAMIEEEASIHYPTIANWTMQELDNYYTATLVADIFAIMPGAILIYFYSGYKVLTVVVSLSSFLHLLTPVALQHHSYTLIAVLLAQKVIETPIEVAVISTWKDWAPPHERTKLVMFSFYGYFLGVACTPLYPYLFEYVTTRESYYFAGFCGLVWSLLWFVVVSDTPSNDPLITETELLFLDDNIPAEVKERGNLRDVPWKSILLSKPVLALCLIYMKIICSVTVILFAGSFFTYILDDYETVAYFFSALLLSYALFLPASTFLLDFVTRKFHRHITNIRKCFICGVFILHALVKIGIISKSLVIKATIFCISYGILSISIPAFITLSLDLCPRYVSIIAGISYTFFALANAGFAYYAEFIFTYTEKDRFEYICLLDGVITLVTAGVFGIWGSAEEQPWSLNRTTIARSNDYLSYPKPEDEDDLKLVTDPV